MFKATAFVHVDILGNNRFGEKLITYCALCVIIGLCSSVVFPFNSLLNSTFLLSLCHSQRLCADGAKSRRMVYICLLFGF